jgi:two-component system cell cycle response regulator CtrA
MRVLLIEDEAATAQSIELLLKTENFTVSGTADGQHGAQLGKLHDYDIILLDLNLPNMSGLDVIRTLRLSKVRTPILVLSGLVGIEEKVSALRDGADDYMSKPFHKEELMARIRAIVRRSNGQSQSSIIVGDLCINLAAGMVDLGGSRLHLTAKEYRILELLSLRKGAIVAKQILMNNLYGGSDEPGIKTLEVLICKLRKKLAQGPDGKNYIDTVRGAGYVLREPKLEGPKLACCGRDSHGYELRRQGCRNVPKPTSWIDFRRPGTRPATHRPPAKSIDRCQ